MKKLLVLLFTVFTFTAVNAQIAADTSTEQVILHAEPLDTTKTYNGPYVYCMRFLAGVRSDSVIREKNKVTVVYKQQNTKLVMSIERYITDLEAIADNLRQQYPYRDLDIQVPSGPGDPSNSGGLKMSERFKGRVKVKPIKF